MAGQGCVEDMRKEICGYILDNWEDTETNKLFYAVKDRKAYFLSVCPKNTPPTRIRDIREKLRDSLLPDCNVNIPTYEKKDTRWICTEPYISSVLYGYGARAFVYLEPAHRQRIILGAINALQTLHWTGLVHGGISCNCFRVCAAKDGSFRTVLAGLAYAGMPSKRKNGYPPGFKAPEMVNDVLSQKTDIYALGAVIYFWLSRNLPIRGENGNLLIPSSIPKAYGRLLTGMLEQDPRKRISLEEAIEIIYDRSTRDDKGYIVYYSERGSEELRDEYIRDIQQIHTGFIDRFTSKIVSQKIW